MTGLRWYTTREIMDRVGLTRDQTRSRLNRMYAMGTVMRKRDPNHPQKWLWAVIGDTPMLPAPSPDLHALAEQVAQRMRDHPATEAEIIEAGVAFIMDERLGGP